jgi:hypothetical protein
VLTVRPLAALIGRDAARWYSRHRARLADAPVPAVAAVAAGVLFAVALVLFTAWQLSAGLVDAAGDTVRTAADTNLARTVLDPVDGYLRGVDGLPATGEQLWTTWAAVTIALFLLAMTGSVGARIGFTVMGALTVGMAYAAAAGPARLVVAGLAATFWALASVPAFARRRPAAVVEPVLQPYPVPVPDPTRDAATGAASRF